MANWDRPTLRDVTEGDVDTGKALLGRLFIENEEPTEHNGRVAIKFDGRFFSLYEYSCLDYND